MARRLQRFHAGEWVSLLREANTAWPLGRNTATPGDDALEVTERKLVDKALTAVADGEIGRAASLLQSNGVAEASSTTAGMLRELLCRWPDRAAPQRDWIDRRKDEAASVDKKTLSATLREASKGGAADLCGWHYEHLQLTLGSRVVFDALHEVTTLIAKGLLSEEFYSLSALGHVTPLKKGLKKKVRPLVCGSTWRRVAMASLCRERKQAFADHLGDDQYAVGTRSALEKLALTIQVLLRKHPGAAALQLDANSAFVDMLRETMLEELEVCSPTLLTAFAQWIARESTVVFFTADGRVIELHTCTGVDQGCPGSPVLFALGMRRAINRIRARLREWLTSCPDLALQTAVLEVLSYLDDLTVVLPPAAVETALPVVEEELQEVGLTVNRDKTLCWSPSGECPPGDAAKKLWDNAPRHDGMVACGAPISSPDWEQELDLDVAVPIGSPAFVESFLEAYKKKTQMLIERILSIPSNCSPGRPAVQSANLMLRSCCSQKAAHLLRLLPPALTIGFAADIDEMMLAAFRQLNGLSFLEEWQKVAITAPLANGGCGTRRLELVCETAFIGAWLQSAPHVARITGNRPSAAPTPDYQALHDATADLSSKYGVDALAELEVTWEELAHTDVDKVQKRLSKLVLDSVYRVWAASLSTVERGAVDSASSAGGSPGASDWLLATPRNLATTMPDDAFLSQLRARLRCDLAPLGATCAYFIQTSNRTCGFDVDKEADHAHGCSHSKVHARHNGLRDLWAGFYTQCGFEVDTEQIVPELGPGDDVLADIRVASGPACPVKYLDVVVAHPVCMRQGRRTASGTGVAAEREARAKHVHYRPRPGGRTVKLVPLAFETYGRWCKESVAELRRLARSRAEIDNGRLAVDPLSVYRGALRRWRQEVSVALQLGNYRVVSACVGPKTPVGVHAAPDTAPTAVELIVD